MGGHVSSLLGSCDLLTPERQFFGGGAHECFMALVSGYAKAFEDTTSPIHRFFSTPLRPVSSSSRKGYEGVEPEFCQVYVSRLQEANRAQIGV